MRIATFSCVLLASCPSPPMTLDCDPDAHGAISGAIFSGPTGDVVRQPLTVTGSAAHDSGLAIRSVTLANVPATPTSDNFGTWTVEIPIGALVTQATDNGDGTGLVTVGATAVDSCGDPHSFGASFEVWVDMTPDVTVDRLEIDPTVTDYAPVGEPGSPVLVRIGGNPDAAGALVAVTATTGSGYFDEPAIGDSVTVTLAGDGTADAESRVLFYPILAGAILLTATAEGQLAASSFLAAAGPTLVPGTSEFAAGDSVFVTVVTEGSIDRCTASSTESGSISVMADGVSLFDASPTRPLGGSPLVLEIEASAMLTQPAAVSITCCDPFDQCGSASYTAQPPPP